MEGWRARRGAPASRGEADGPRVEECAAALVFWRASSFLVREMHLSCERTDDLLDPIVDGVEEARTEAPTSAAAVTRDRPREDPALRRDPGLNRGDSDCSYQPLEGAHR